MNQLYTSCIYIFILCIGSNIYFILLVELVKFVAIYLLFKFQISQKKKKKINDIVLIYLHLIFFFFFFLKYKKAKKKKKN